MYSIKGFISIPSFAINTPGIVAPIGELSSNAMTFSQEKGFYTDAAYPDVKLVAFSSKEDTTLIEVPVDVKEHLFTVAGWIYAQMIAGTDTEDRTAFLVALGTNFTDIEDVACGAIVTNGSYSVPEWVSWKRVGEDQYVRVWFADASFQLQYDEYEIVVIPALENVDDFFRPAAEVEARLKLMTMAKMVERMQTARALYPETIVKVENYNYVDPADSTHKLLTSWGLLIYGAAGNNIDSLKDALVTYILEHSAHPREDWLDLLPDLFKRTEFILTPLWDQYAIPNRTLEAGIHSSVTKIARALEVAQETATEYTALHVETYLTLMSHTYKSLMLTVVGGPENREGKFFLTDFYPDYITVNTSSVDFNRMSVETQEWAMQLAALVIAAETVTPYSVLPAGITRVLRDDVLYVVKTVDNVQFLVVAKSNFA